MASLAALVETSQRVAATRARLAKVRELAACLRALEPAELEIGAHYLAGELPQGRIGTGWAALREAAATAPAAEPGLSLAEVDRRLGELAAIRGAGSAERRAAALRELFSRATAAEQAFLLHLVTGELRQGALAGLSIDAIAAAAELPLPVVRRAAMYAPSLGEVTRVALLEGAAGLARFQLAVGSPLAPMLAQTAEDVDAAFAELSPPLAFDWKIDGARIQVHRAGDTVRAFTRALNEVTPAIPEVIEAIQSLPLREAVLDGEVVALDAAGRPHPFQVTMRRFGRRLDVAALRAELPVQAFFFDCLQLDGETLADRPAAERFAALERALPQSMRVPRLTTSSVEEARAFYEAALRAGHEGLMAKSLDAPYEAGARGAAWRKIKRAHTLDLVVLAAEWGHGRRTGKLSNLHLGALDAETGLWVMLGKTFKGLSDAVLEWQTAELLAREVRREGIAVHVRPELVVEVAFSDLQASPRYPGGIALRLARVKHYRPEKPAAEADTMDTVRKLFAAQGGERSE
ncbi:MAG TPA: ATP-dependent DNA ligase [Myxococcota bacterium]|nr:ATP-dependent DNA ligase [Myxococcota bacterium]